MGMTRVTVDVLGPERFCPDCHRLLVSVNPDGTVNISGKTSMMLESSWIVPGEINAASVAADDGEPGEMSSEGFITEAVCNLRGCRFKRWLRETWGMG